MKTLFSVLILFIITIDIAEGQRVTLIQNDKRIQKYQEHFVKYLIEKKQLEIHQPPFKMKHYQTKMYVTKRLEFYNGSEGLLLVQFGNLDDHGWVCWGLLGSNQINLFLNTKDDNFKKLSVENSAIVTSTVKAYVDIMD